MSRRVRLKIEAVRGRRAGGVALAARYPPVRALCPGPGYRQVVVIASGLSWATVLVAFAGNPGTGWAGSELGDGLCIVVGRAGARWSRSALPSCRWAWPSRRSEAIARRSVAADGAGSLAAPGLPRSTRPGHIGSY